MVHQPDAYANLCPTISAPSPATNMLINSNHPYSIPKKGKTKRHNGTFNTHLSIFLPKAPIAIASTQPQLHPNKPTSRKSQLSSTTP